MAIAFLPAAFYYGLVTPATYATPIALSLRAIQLTLLAGSRKLISNLDILLKPGEVLGILGANGAGKSTLLTVLAGLARPALGEVILGEQALHHLAPRMRAQHIGLLPQSDEVGFFGTVSDFVTLGYFPYEGLPQHLDAQLAIWELTPLANRALDTLSGGERQRARLAQLSIQNPQCYLLDEPLTHLDPAHQARLLAWIRAQADRNKSVIFTLHDPNWAAWHCDRLLFLFGDGRWQIGTPESMLHPDSLETLYGQGTAALWNAALNCRLHK